MMEEQYLLPHNRPNLSQEKIRIINSVLNKIPQLSLSVRKIIEMASDKDVDSKELVEVASSDPVLASKILMMVNSSYYGLNHKIDNLRLAIVLLGFNEVRNLALQFGFMSALSGLDVDRMYDPKTLWVHSYLVSICAESFSSEDDPKRAGVLMTLGILHDIGKFALHAIGVMMEKKGIKIESKKVLPPDISLLVIEENLFGVNHSVIGAMLAERWNLSERTCAVIEHHHSPLFLDISEIQEEYIEDITITCMSDIIVNSLTNDEKKFSELHPAFFERLGLKPPIEKLFTDELRLKISTAEEYARNLE